MLILLYFAQGVGGKGSDYWSPSEMSVLLWPWGDSHHLNYYLGFIEHLQSLGPHETLCTHHYLHNNGDRPLPHFALGGGPVRWHDLVKITQFEGGG